MLLRAFGLAAVLALPFASCASSPAPAPAVLHAATPVAIDGIKRFREVEPGFWRGSRPSESALLALKARGVRTIVSLREDDDERARARAAGLDYVELPMSATPFGAKLPTDAQVSAFLDVVADPARRPVYVHCKHGRDRTGVMVALWRVKRGGWAPEAAVDEMEDLGLSPQYRNYRRFIRTLGAPPGA
jgi:protein tyrosine/serine phosphatase